jgi:hypothetical protein
MPYPSQKPSETAGLNVILFTIPQSVLLQAGTGTVLMALLGAKAFSETLQAIGQASEEVFRGDRLPILEFPVATESELG